MLMIVISGVIPALAIGTVWAVEGLLRSRAVRTAAGRNGELRTLATRLRGWRG